MNRRQPARPAPQPVKGSWEDLLLQAQQLARSYNDQAIPLYRKIVDGLLALPPAQREAGKRRLHNVLMAAGLDLQGYLNVRDRLDEALAVVDQVRAVADAEDAENLATLRIEILLQSGHADEAFAELRAAAEAPDATLGDWGALVMAHIRAGRAQDALPVLDQMEQTAIAAAGEGAQEPSRSDAAYIAGLRGITALEAGDIDAGIAHFERVMQLGGAYAQNLHLLYGRLIHAGRYDEALRFVDQDQARPVRAAFWRGVALQHKGESALARRKWESIVNTDLVKSDQNSIMEYVLAHYYLGDPQGKGLEIVLQAMRDQRSVPWVMLFLAGLGWAVRGDLRSARSNLQLAVTQRKSLAEGSRLPKHYWFFTQDVVKPEIAAQLAEFFEDGVPSSAEAPVP
jgi:tetratricopeptide (TPR) repeat protein